jgi:hypothetical protein
MEKGLVLDFVGLSQCIHAKNPPPRTRLTSVTSISHRNPSNLPPSPPDRRLSLLLPTIHSLRRLPRRPNTSRVIGQTPPTIETISIEIEAEEERIGTFGGCGFGVGFGGVQ